MRRFLFAGLLVVGASCSRTSEPKSAPTPQADGTKGAGGGEKGSGETGAPGEPRLHAEGVGFTIEVEAPTEAAIGSSAVARVVLKPRDGHKVAIKNTDPTLDPPPIGLTVVAPAGVDVEKLELAREDATKLDEKEA